MVDEIVIGLGLRMESITISVIELDKRCCRVTGSFTTETGLGEMCAAVAEWPGAGVGCRGCSWGQLQERGQDPGVAARRVDRPGAVRSVRCGSSHLRSGEVARLSTDSGHSM